MQSGKSLNNMVDDFLRRSVDIMASLIGVVVLFPLFILVGIAIKWDSPGPVFYRARRVGRYGREFRLWKFRTMVADAESQGPGITASGDSRITRVGHFLRRTKIDELPQLVNVLLGDMSLVGPRPEDPRYVALYTSEQRKILEVRPGITSAASLAYRHEEQLLSGDDWEEVYRNQVLPDKLAIDLNYLEHRTFLSDIQLIFRTIIAVVK